MIPAEEAADEAPERQKAQRSSYRKSPLWGARFALAHEAIGPAQAYVPLIKSHLGKVPRKRVLRGVGIRYFAEEALETGERPYAAFGAMAFLIDQPTPIQAWTAVSELAYSFESDEPPATLGFQISEPSSVNDPRFTQTLELCPPTQRHFNVHGAVWLSLSDVARSVRENSTVGWIAGWALAAITWSIGGFDGIAQSVAVLAALNSILLPLVDLKRREFTLTKTVGEVLQFPVYLTLVALGTFVDRAGAHGFMRLLIAGLIVIPICAGRSFRNLLVLADLQGVDTLLDRWLADLTDFINQNIRGRDR